MVFEQRVVRRFNCAKRNEKDEVVLPARSLESQDLCHRHVSSTYDKCNNIGVCLQLVLQSVKAVAKCQQSVKVHAHTFSGVCNVLVHCLKLADLVSYLVRMD